MTTSMLPMMAGTSAIRQPLQISLATLRLRETRRAGPHAERNGFLGRPADDVEAHLPARTFGFDVGFARRQVPRRLRRDAIPGQSDSASGLARLILMLSITSQHAHVEPVPAIADHRFRRGFRERRNRTRRTRTARSRSRARSCAGPSRDRPCRGSSEPRSIGPVQP